MTAGGLFGLDAFAQRNWEWLRQRLDRIPPTTRRRLEFAALIVAFFYSGFAAWSDEHAARLAAEHKPLDLEKRVAELSSEIAALRSGYWPALSKSEVIALRARLREISPDSLVVNCHFAECAELSKSVVVAFDGTPWRATHEGVTTMDSLVSGIWLSPNDAAAQALKLAIEGSTPLTVNITRYDRKISGIDGYRLVIGSKPLK